MPEMLEIQPAVENAGLPLRWNRSDPDLHARDHPPRAPRRRLLL